MDTKNLAHHISGLLSDNFIDDRTTEVANSHIGTSAKSTIMSHCLQSSYVMPLT